MNRAIPIVWNTRNGLIHSTTIQLSTKVVLQCSKNRFNYGRLSVETLVFNLACKERCWNGSGWSLASRTVPVPFHKNKLLDALVAKYEL